MRQTTKKLLGVVAISMVTSGLTAVTTYSISKRQLEGESRSFETLFKQNTSQPAVRTSGAGVQPVDFTQAAESSLHAVVHIKCTQNSKVQTMSQGDMPDIFEYFFGPQGGNRGRQQMQSQPRVGYGSGVILSKDGYIVTNNHVVEGADEIDVTLNDNREFKARLIGTDASTDLALLKIQGDNFPTIPVGDSDALKVGEWVLAVGNPFNLNSTVTAGIVSAKARSLGVYNTGKNNGIESFIQTDAAINPGNSGGALVNVKGELVGINAVLSSPTGSFAGYGFAIPTTIMKKVVSDLKEFGTVQRALLGVVGGDVANFLQDEKLKEKVKDSGCNDGVYVNEVPETGAAHSAGIKAGDIIVAADGRKIKSMAELQETIAKHKPGDKLTVKVIRDKKPKEFTVTLRNSQGNTKVMKNVDMDLLGAAFRPLSSDLKKQLNLSGGLQVSGVTGGKMKEAGITKGFIILKVNGQAVNSNEDMENAFKSASRSADQVMFISGIYPSGKKGNYAVDLSEE
ncbi:MAG: Do family serine endopeptidase [Bacteroidaceae bacterium]|jgi:Do/DeqQ family serine protease|nr:Do family serine endopeptidase [Bacteroidaceae bacterium]